MQGVQVKQQVLIWILKKKLLNVAVDQRLMSDLFVVQVAAITSNSLMIYDIFWGSWRTKKGKNLVGYQDLVNM